MVITWNSKSEENDFLIGFEGLPVPLCHLLGQERLSLDNAFIIKRVYMGARQCTVCNLINIMILGVTCHWVNI